MSEVIVHTIPGSPSARATLATLEEKQVSWRIAPLRPRQHREPAHLARNPFGRMPVIEHGDFTLYETQAMGLTPDLAAIEAALPNARRVFNVRPRGNE
jgi:glutathione S-transferase